MTSGSLLYLSSTGRFDPCPGSKSGAAHCTKRATLAPPNVPPDHGFMWLTAMDWRDMDKQQISEILAKPYAQQLLNGPEPARLAYHGRDGAPRAIPIGFWTEGEQIVMGRSPSRPRSPPSARTRRSP